VTATNLAREPAVSPIDPGTLQALREVESELDARWPETKLEPSIDRIAALADLLGDPQHASPVIHVAGTNGKTSTSRMIDSLLTRIGLRTGRFTSPHLQMVTERISLDGAPIDPSRYVATYHDVQPYVSLVDSRSDVRMSKFEVLTGMAFAAFADAPVDVAVVEVGLGGTWDATNIVDAAVAVISPVDIDHTEFLGTEITAIAAEKAGIIKQGSLVVLAEQRAEVADVIANRCAEMNARCVRFGIDFGVLAAETAVGGQLLRLQGLGGVYEEIFLPLHGAHQAANAALALAAVEMFFGAGDQRQLDIEAVRAAFAAVASPGRLERVRSAPTILLDAAHNPHGARALATALADQFVFRKLIGVVSVMGDKDVKGILAALEPVLAEIVLTSNGSPRAMDADELAGVALDVFGSDRIVVEPRLDDAIETAVSLAEQTDAPNEPVAGAGVVVTGSVVTAGAARALFGKEPA